MSRKRPNISFTATFAAATAAGMAALLLATPLPATACYLLSAGAALFALMSYDKKAAGRSGHRIPEMELLFFSLVGGAIGGMAAIAILRHKTRKPTFSLIILLFSILYTLLLLWALHSS